MAATIICCLPYYLIFPEGWQRFRMLNLSVTIGMGGILYKGNLGAQMFLQYLLHPFLGSEACFSFGFWSWSPLTLTVTLLSVGAVLLALLATFFSKADKSALFAIWLCVFFLIFRDIWENQYVMFLPALAILYCEELFAMRFFLPIYFILALPSFHYFVREIPEQDFSTMQNILYYGPKPFAVFCAFIGLLFISFFRANGRIGKAKKSR